MSSFLRRHQGITHLLIDLIYAGSDRSYETSAGHGHIDCLQGDALLSEKIRNRIAAHATLIHNRLILSDFLCRMCEILFKKHLTRIIKSDLCRCRSCIDN